MGGGCSLGHSLSVTQPGPGATLMMTVMVIRNSSWGCVLCREPPQQPCEPHTQQWPPLDKWGN